MRSRRGELIGQSVKLMSGLTPQGAGHTQVSSLVETLFMHPLYLEPLELYKSVITCISTNMDSRQ